MARPRALTLALAMTFLVSAGATTETASERSEEPPPERLEDELRVHFYNVGAGTCTLVECPGPNARPIIIDCGNLEGGRDDHTISNTALKRRIENTLDGHSPEVVLSHSDKDHVSLIPHVLVGIEVVAIWQGDDPRQYRNRVGDWVSDEQKRGAELHSDFPKNWHNDDEPIANGLDCGDASSYVLTVNSGHGEHGDQGEDDDNDNSLVLMLEYGAFRIIFTGDATGVTENAAMENFKTKLRATVLAASHHGASTEGSNSKMWARETKPQVVIYSAGKLYGHPTCAARQRLDYNLAETPKHAAICGESSGGYDRSPSERAEYMTHVNGAITVTTNGRSPLRLDCERGPGCAAVKIPFK